MFLILASLLCIVICGVEAWVLDDWCGCKQDRIWKRRHELEAKREAELKAKREAERRPALAASASTNTTSSATSHSTSTATSSA